MKFSILVAAASLAAMMTTPAAAISTKFSVNGAIQVGKTGLGHASSFGTTIRGGKVTLHGEKETVLDLGKVKGRSGAGGALKF